MSLLGMLIKAVGSDHTRGLSSYLCSGSVINLQYANNTILVDKEEELHGKVLPLLDLIPLVYHYDSKSSSWNS
jgi:hypothetical protein